METTETRTLRRAVALVVYESMFGNTHAIAEAVADGIRTRMAVDVCVVTELPPRAVTRYDLVVAGAPTHAFTLSRESTRADAIRQGATEGTAAYGMRDWLHQLPPGLGRDFAAFDTRVEVVRHLPGSAARKAARIAGAADYRVLGHETFRVLGVSGPLMSGEEGRARKWGARLASDLLGRVPNAG